MAGTGTSAQAAPWCAFYDPSTYNCGFHSFEQCLATVRGAGGWCRPNFFEGYTGDRTPSTSVRVRAASVPIPKFVTPCSALNTNFGIERTLANLWS